MESSDRPVSNPSKSPIDPQQVPGAADLRHTSELNPRAKLGRGAISEGVHAPDRKIEIVYHEEEELEFLDFYGEKSHGEVMLRRRKPIPGRQIQREIPRQTPHLRGLMTPSYGVRGRQQPARGQVALRIPSAAHSPFSAAKEKEETGILIQSRKGALYLHDTSYRSFCDLIKRLVRDEGGSKYFIEFKRAETEPPREYPIDLQSGEHSYKAEILPRLNVRDIEARVRSDSYDGGENSMPDSPASGRLKIIAHGVGYIYCSANWLLAKDNLIQNSGQFLKALDLLFPHKTEDYQAEHFTVVVPGYGSYNINRSFVPALNSTIQESLSRVTGLEGQEHNEIAAEIFVSTMNTALPDQSVIPGQARDIIGGDSPERSIAEAQRETSARELEPHQHSLPVPKSVYKTRSGSIYSPRHEPSLKPEIRGRHGIPLFNPRILTLSEIEELQRQLRLRENELLQREEYCRVCDKTFRHGSSEDQISHLISSHLHRRSPLREGCPVAGCLKDLADIAEFPNLGHVLEHLETHVERRPIARATGHKRQIAKLSSYPGHHTDSGLSITQQREQHYGTHSPSRSSGITKDIETQTERPVSDPPPISSEKSSALKRLYCNSCFECMQSLSEKRRQNHAEAKCQTTVKAFLLLTATEAKERKAAMKAAKAEQTRKTAASVTRTLRNREYSTPVETEVSDEETDTNSKRKRKPTAKAIPTPNKRSRKK